MSPQQLAAEVAAGTAPAILDVRSRVEFDCGHVPGARHLPFWQAPWRAGSLGLDRDEPLVVYCGHGPRAWMAGATLALWGFRRIRFLAGHYHAWRVAGCAEEPVRPVDA